MDMNWVGQVFNQTLQGTCAARGRFAGRPGDDSLRAISLIDQRANANARSEEGVPALRLAVLHADRRAVVSIPGNSDLVRVLLSAGADPKEAATTEPGPVAFVSGGRETPLIESANDVTGGTARLLLDAGADVNAADGTGSTALMWAAYKESGDPAVVSMLLRAGANPDQHLAISQRPGERRFPVEQRVFVRGMSR